MFESKLVPMLGYCQWRALKSREEADLKYWKNPCSVVTRWPRFNGIGHFCSDLRELWREPRHGKEVADHHCPGAPECASRCESEVSSIDIDHSDRMSRRDKLTRLAAEMLDEHVNSNQQLYCETEVLDD